MIPAKWLQKLFAKAIPLLAENLLQRSEQNPLQEGETDYIYFIVNRRDENGAGKMLMYHAAGNLSERPFKLTRILWGYNLQHKVLSLDVEKYQAEIKQAIKDGTIEDNLKSLNIKND